MSIGDSTIRIIRTDGLMLIGDCQAGEMISPRVLNIQPREGGQAQISFLRLLGDPRKATMGTPALSYEVTDEALIGAYRESVTGLVMARPANVVNLQRN